MTQTALSTPADAESCLANLRELLAVVIEHIGKRLLIESTDFPTRVPQFERFPDMQRIDCKTLGSLF